MDRREFLKIASTVVPAWSLIPVASAQSPLYTGRILINIHADGGLDAFAAAAAASGESYAVE